MSSGKFNLAILVLVAIIAVFVNCQDIKVIKVSNTTRSASAPGEETTSSNSEELFTTPSSEETGSTTPSGIKTTERTTMLNRTWLIEHIRNYVRGQPNCFFDEGDYFVLAEMRPSEPSGEETGTSPSGIETNESSVSDNDDWQLNSESHWPF